MFSLAGRQSDTAIPTITKVPLTKEEIERRRRVRIVVIGIAIVSAIAIALAARYAWHRRAIATTREAAEASGRLTDIAAALAELEGETGAGDVALAARLHATAELAGETGHRERAEALLAAHDATADGASDHRIAATYLALAAGDVATALREASPLQPSGPRAAESAHARALAAAAAGNVEQALSMAQAAATAMPSSPRHRALLVEIAARAGAPAPAAGEGDDATSMHAARALAVVFRGGSSADARTEASAVLASSDATPSERTSATLVTGLASALEGDTESARSSLGEIVAAPGATELVRVLAAEGELWVGARTEAEAIVTALPADVTADAGARARVQTLLALTGGQAEAAAAAVASVPEGPRRAWLEGRIASARGSLDLARAAYARAASEPWAHVLAASDLALLEARAGRGTEAVAAIEPLLAAGATWPRVATAGALALSAAGQNDRALTVVEAALTPHPNEGALLAARGRVHFAAEHWAPAVESLRAAITHDDDDATLHRDLGLAERRLDHAAESRTALARAVELDATDRAALVPLLELDVAAGELTDAAAVLTRLDAIHETSLDIEHLRARVLVGNRAGQSGTRAVLAALRTARRDGDLHLALGRLYFQAERWTDAMIELQAAQETSEPRRTVLLWRLIAMGHLGREAPVTTALEALREDATETATPFTPEDEALVSIAQGWIALHDQQWARVEALASRVLRTVPDSSEAALLLARLDEAQARDPEAHFRQALAGQPASVDPLGGLALLGEPTPERCDFGRRYVAAAPTGPRAHDVRARLSTCPR